MNGGNTRMEMSVFRFPGKLCPKEDLEKAIMIQNSVPGNIDNTRKKTVSLKVFLKGKLNNEKNAFEKLKDKTRDVMDPLAKLWTILEYVKQAEEEAVQVSITEVLYYIEQTVILLVKSSNAINCNRRWNVLEYIMNL